jgi:hypothetical protein|tara:strand:- start:117 stop:377 length:261 start_codon:yes stop_codon:yes gene_type:complete
MDQPQNTCPRTNTQEVTLELNFNKMAEYKCDCNDKVVDKSGVTIKYIEGEGVIHEVKCEDCGKYMTLANPKSGAPGFRSNRFGQTF